MAVKSFTVTGAREVLADLDRIGSVVAAQIRSETTGHARELQAAVRRNAATGYHAPGLPHIPGTGPGPNVATGEYRASIRVRQRSAGGQFATSATAASAEVYTDDPRANRLEYGFFGTDSRGRSYKSPAYPHWGPATEEVEASYMEALDRLVAVAVGAGTPAWTPSREERMATALAARFTRGTGPRVGPFRRRR